MEAVKLWEETVCLWGCQHGLSVQGGHLLLGEWIGPCAPGERGGLWVRKDWLCAELPTSMAVCFVGSVSFLGSGQSLSAGQPPPGTAECCGAAWSLLHFSQG